MKKMFPLLAIVCIMMAGFTACSPSLNFDEDMLIGKWQNDANEQEYWVYTTETDATGSYQYGHTWDESQETFESDLVPYGNGWFKWQLVQSDLTQIHLMDNQGAEIPKIYTVTLLTGTTLQYKDSFNKQYSFTKVK